MKMVIEVHIFLLQLFAYTCQRIRHCLSHIIKILVFYITLPLPVYFFCINVKVCLHSPLFFSCFIITREASGLSKRDKTTFQLGITSMINIILVFWFLMEISFLFQDQWLPGVTVGTRQEVFHKTGLSDSK